MSKYWLLLISLKSHTAKIISSPIIRTIQRHFTRYHYRGFCNIFRYVFPSYFHIFDHRVYHFFKSYGQDGCFGATHPIPLLLFRSMPLGHNQCSDLYYSISKIYYIITAKPLNDRETLNHELIWSLPWSPSPLWEFIHSAYSMIGLRNYTLLSIFHDILPSQSL